MKEQIYTIPINEAIEADTECPFCAIARRLEAEAVEYTLGAAMMEPDYRLLCNEKGFCRHHFAKLYEKQNKLSLALILDSRYEELRRRFKKPEKKKLFKRNEPQKDSCVICDKVNSTLERYAETFFYMWKKDTELSGKILASKGFCVPHFYYLAERAQGYLPHPDEFIEPVYKKQTEELERLHNEVHRFTLKFDYRNGDLPWENAKDSPIRALEKSVGYIN